MKLNVQRSRSYIILSFLLLTAALQCSAARTYYVDAKSGNDANSGYPQSSAFRTIKKAVSVMSPGDICQVNAGNYPERVTITRSGTSGSPIVIKASGAGVITRGFTIVADNIKIDGFEITGTDPRSWKDGAGIHIRGRNCVISNNYIHNVFLEGIRLGDDLTSAATSSCTVTGNRMIRCGQAGIQICGQNNLIENNEISGTVQWSVTNPQNLDADGMRFFGSGHIIRKNYIHDILLSDPENGAAPHIDCVQTWGPATNIIFEQNNFSVGEPDKNKQIAMITEVASPVRDIVFRNNVFRDTFRGLNVFGSYQPDKPSPLYNISILNNTFVNFHNNAFELHDCPGAKVMNNIIYNCESIYIDAKTQNNNFTNGYNCYYRSDGKSVAGVSPAPTDLWNVNPHFTNPRQGNFKLSAGSPLIGRGKAVENVKNDYSGKKRTGKKACDIGAFTVR
ncbi:MAG: DUF1565 domain-containing protein [Ignavibacteriales bacterium]